MPTPEARRARRIGQRWVFVGLLVVVLSVWYTNYGQAVNSRKGCHRSVVSNRLSASNWGTAYDETAARYVRSGSRSESDAAVVYRLNAETYAQLALTDCGSSYPLPFPLHI